MGEWDVGESRAVQGDSAGAAADHDLGGDPRSDARRVARGWIISAEAGHVALIASRARRADREELWSSSRQTPAQALLYGLSEGNAYTGVVDGVPVCMFGIVRANVLGGFGVPWLIGTDGIERNARAFLRESRPVFEALRTGYHTLANHVDERNAVAHRWLRWLGFTLLRPEPHGPDRLPFRPFYWRREDV